MPHRLTPIPISHQMPGQAVADVVTSQRFEMKYRLTPLQAEIVRQHIDPYVFADPKAKFGHRYPLSSVYLDSPDLALFWASNLGENKRFKLRVRTYSEDPAEPAFFEIKSRLGGIVMKKRAMVHKEWIPHFFAGRRLPREALFLDHHNEWDNLELFRAHVERLGAIPRLHVRYIREAYMSRDDDPVRLTFDSQIACLPSVGPIDRVRLNGKGWRDLLPALTIFEIKFTNSYPCWIQDLIQRLALQRDSFAKYVMCVRMLKEEGHDLKHPIPAGGHWHERAG